MEKVLVKTQYFFSRAGRKTKKYKKYKILHHSRTLSTLLLVVHLVIIKSNQDVIQDMRKTGKRFQVDIVEGCEFWFSTIHESMSQAEKKNFNQKTLHLVPTTIQVMHICSEKPKDNHGVVGMQEKGKGLNGILQNSFSLTGFRKKLELVYN